MSMILALAPVSDTTIKRLLADPPLLWQIVAPDDPEAYERSRREAAGRKQPGWLARVFGAQARADDPRPTLPLELSDGEGDLKDLDKAWHAIHYLLTGTADEGNAPLDFLVAGGTYLEDDVGYGPPRVFTSSETREIAAALARVSDDELRKRYAPAAMMAAEIYPEIWDRKDDDDPLGYVMDHLGTLRETLASATASGRGLMVYLS